MDMMEDIEISVVIPLYNESGNINTLYIELQPVLKKLSSRYEILFVDDGSSDDSYERVCKLKEVDPQVSGISFSRNFGHQAAIFAGMEHARGKVVITMDADLQHPPFVIPLLYDKCREGFDIVNTVRIDAAGTGLLKKLTSKLFYHLINLLSEVRIEPGSADFRLMNRKAVDAFLAIKEKDRFTRGLISWMGYRQAFINYKALPRHSGKTKYTFRKMFKFAADGITSFSSRPLVFAFYLGVVVFLLALGYFIFSFVEHFMGKTIPGWTSLMLAVLLLGSVQLVLLGVIGSYIARIYNESKNRPVYFIRDKTSS